MLLSASFTRKQAAPVLDGHSPAAREPRYSVAVLDAQYEYLNRPLIAPPPEPRQLEGPPAAPANEAA
jgi:hypothetical protein